MIDQNSDLLIFCQNSLGRRCPPVGQGQDKGQDKVGPPPRENPPTSPSVVRVSFENQSSNQSNLPSSFKSILPSCQVMHPSQTSRLQPTISKPLFSNISIYLRRGEFDERYRIELLSLAWVGVPLAAGGQMPASSPPCLQIHEILMNP